MVEFETLSAEEVKFGNNNFIEVARKRAISEEGTNEFVAISRGFFAPDGSKRFKKSFTVPDAPEVVDFIAAKIKEMTAASAASAPAAEAAPAAEEAPAEAEESAAEDAPAEESEAEAVAEEPAKEEEQSAE